MEPEPAVLPFMSTPQLLAPAGSFEHALAALRSGADALYAAPGPFNLRAGAGNIDPDDFQDLVDLVHGAGKKLYAVLNALAHDQMMPGIDRLLHKLARCGKLPDAFIVSDPGVMERCRALCPGVALHLSTQTGVFNTPAVRFWAQLGVSRIILPRELDLSQIRTITSSGWCETEIFIHGAMCVAISGRCLLGEYRSGRSANRGDCPQPCRVRYRITEISSDTPVSWDAEESEQGAYLLNSRDLETLALLPEIAATGVHALKIEGRNKSVHYVATVVGVYRQALDALASDRTGYTVRQEWRTELDRIEHRPYSTGFYGERGEQQSSRTGKHPSSVRVVGLVRELLDDGSAVVDVRNPFSAQEPLSLLRSGKPAVDDFVVRSPMKDLRGEPATRAQTNRLVVFAPGHGLRPGDLLRRECAKREDGDALCV